MDSTNVPANQDSPSSTAVPSVVVPVVPEAVIPPKAGLEQDLVRDPVTGKILPGKTLNPSGMKRGTKHLTTLLKEALARTDAGEAEPNDKIIIDRVTHMAKRGDLAAVSMVWGRVEGSVPQTIVHEGDGISGLSDEQKKKLNTVLGISDEKLLEESNIKGQEVSLKDDSKPTETAIPLEVPVQPLVPESTNVDNSAPAGTTPTV